MKTPHRFTAPLALAAALAIPVLTNGCSSDITNPGGALCCTDFKVGADLTNVDFGVDASIKGQFAAFAQAAGDLSAVASDALDSVANACRKVATAGGANSDKAEPTDPKERVSTWCSLADARIKAVLTGGLSVKAVVDAPQCEASVSAAASCQANCGVDAGCDVKAKPPTCEGGTMEVSCQGGCTASASAPSVSCEGSCDANCTGSCTAQGGVAVDCEGKCDGTCSAGGSANGSGVQADGSCKGQCQGTCTASATAPAVKCAGSCNGQCTGKCTASPGSASVKCDGSCDGSFTPLSCKGGTLKASCQVDAHCDANCNASVQAKAECTPPKVDLQISGSITTGEASIVIDALRDALPDIFVVFTVRGQAFVKMVGDVSASASAVVDPGKLGVKGTACLAAIVPVLAQAADNMSAAFNASVTIAGDVGNGG